MLSPRESGKLVSSLTERIKINNSGISKLGDKLIQEFICGNLKPDNFSQCKHHPGPEDLWALDWIFFVDTINFCFWSSDDKIGWRVKEETGYFALCAAVNRAIIEEGEKILKPEFYSKITEQQLSRILRSDTPVKISLLSERVKCLQEAGTVLLEKFRGSVEYLIRQADNSAMKMLNIIVKNFNCYGDEATYKGHKVALYKRAQILIGDIWVCFKNSGVGYFVDINEITMFADYRVPQVLQYFGIFEYSDDLLKKLNSVLENGDEIEVEIRGCSIHAVELLKEYVQKKNNIIVNSILIDHFLWDFRRKHAREILNLGLPYHKTMCIYY